MFISSITKDIRAAFAWLIMRVMAKTLSPIVVSIAAKMILKTISGNRLISAADRNKLSVTNIKRIFSKISQIVFSFPAALR